MTQKVKPQHHPDFVGGWVWTELESRWIEDRIAEAILAEREACAQIVNDDRGLSDDDAIRVCRAIRARGEKA
jgi:plasmid maintenance system antidote protein VapI